MKVVTLLNEKGGVSKTTIATHLAAGLAIRGNRVLLIDSDPQAHATIAFGLQKEPGFYDYIMRGTSYKDILRVVPPERYALPDDAADIGGNLMLIPGNVESRNLASNLSDAFVILRRLHTLKDHVDYVIIDTAPTPTLLHASIYMATDWIIFPTKCEAWSFDGLRESLIHRENFDAVRREKNLPDTKTIGIVPVQYRQKTMAHTENLKLLQDNFGDLVWDVMPMRTIWADVADVKRSVFSVAPDSQAALDMWLMVDRVEALRVQP